MSKFLSNSSPDARARQDQPARAHKRKVRRKRAGLLVAATLLASMAVIGNINFAGAAAAATDSCNYPFSSAVARTSTTFAENEVLRSGALVGTDADPKIAVFYNDEHALTLGVNQGANPPVTAMGANPDHAANPSIGDPSVTDPSARPIYPALFVTDITSAPTSKAGDWQNSGTPVKPNDVFGTWKAATKSGTTLTNGVDPAKNNTNIGGPANGADPYPAIAKNEGYGAEIRWNGTGAGGLGLLSGHTYRVQAMVHDGDQNKTGGDAGEFCINITMPGPPTLTSDTTGSTTALVAHNSITVPVGTSIADTLILTGTASGGQVTGTADAHLYFWPNGTSPATPADACVAANEVTSTSVAPILADANFPDLNEAVVAGSPSHATSKSHAVGNALGKYYWQWHYDGAGKYTAADETCGEEIVTLAQARLRISPYEASNVLNFPHTVTATLDYTTDGSSFTNISGATVTFTASGAATFVAGNGPTCSTGAGGTCTVKIVDSTVETVTLHASATGFSASPTVTGAFGTVSTDTHSNCPGLATATTTCDATKTYVKPSTTMSVKDRLVGLPATTNGTVSYLSYTDKAHCLAGPPGGTDVTDPAHHAVTGGVADPSLSVDVAAGAESWFTATITDGTTSYTTECIESVVNHS